MRTLIAALFAALAIPVLAFLALTVPTGDSPDEVAHVLRADSVRMGQMIGRRITKTGPDNVTVTEGTIRAHTELLLTGFAFPPGTPLARRQLTRERLDLLDGVQWQPTTASLGVPNTAVYSPLLYVPGALGIQAAVWAGAGPFRATIAARLANGLAYAVIGLAALLLARRLHGALFAALMLPMSLWMAASCSQDGLIIALAALSAALLTRATTAAWIGGTVALAIIIVAKPPYIPLALIPALFPPGARTPIRARAAMMLLAALPGVAWFALARAVAVVPFVREPSFRPGPLWPGPDQLMTSIDPANQMLVLLHDPLLVLTLPLRSFWADALNLGVQAVGLLSNLDLFIPTWLYTLWLVALIASAVGDGIRAEHAPRPPGPRARILAFGAVLATVFALFDAQYLSWTHTGAALVEGVQGRYFDPLLPFAALALPALRGPATLRAALHAPTIAAGLAGLVALPALIVVTYYLR